MVKWNWVAVWPQVRKYQQQKKLLDIFIGAVKMK